MSLSHLEVVKLLAEPKALEILDFITTNELVTTKSLKEKFGNVTKILSKIIANQLAYKIQDPLISRQTIWKPTLRTNQVLSAISIAIRDIEAA